MYVSTINVLEANFEVCNDDLQTANSNVLSTQEALSTATSDLAICDDSLGTIMASLESIFGLTLEWCTHLKAKVDKQEGRATTSPNH